MSEKIKLMFDSIARKYDLLNDVLSFGLHRSWKRKTARTVAVNARDILDVAAGTGDMTVEISSLRGKKVTAFDFSEKMLAVAYRKFIELEIEADIVQGDAMAMPFDDSSFDSACIAFGIRNIDSPEQCLKEMARVVKPGGRVVILEFGKPTGLFGVIYRMYSVFIMPFVGNLIAGNRKAYVYLQESAARFPSGKRFEALMHSTLAFSRVTSTKLSMGIAYIYVGIK